MSTKTDALVDATADFLTVWTADTLLEDIATALSCSEMDALYDLLVEYGKRDAALSLLEAHREGDDEGDEHFTGEDA
jgi:hypothetical protein